MNQEKCHGTSTKNSSGYVLLGLFPLVLVGSIFAAGAIEESGNRSAGWLWIPLCILVLFAFAIIHYRLNTRRQCQVFLFPVFAKSVFKFVAMQILVLVVLGTIAMLLARVNPFSSMGNNW